MATKRVIVLLVIAAFTLGLVGMSFSAEEVKGTVSKIEGNKLTIADDTGKEITVSVQDPKTLQGLKVGDRVLVKDGKVTKEKT